MELNEVRGRAPSGTHGRRRHAGFGLGRDERHVSPTDMAGVALAAAKALKAADDTLKAELAGLADIKARLKALGSAVSATR